MTPTQRYYRRVIRIRAIDSPNVRRALHQQALGLVPDGRVVVPGVLTWEEYQERLATWDPVRRCVGLDGDFYEGAEVLLFPPEWLNRAEQLHAERAAAGPARRLLAQAVGVDPGEGGAETSVYVVAPQGVVDSKSWRTQDTSVIRREVVATMRRHGVPAENVALDRGGGGKQIADELRAAGHAVRTVAFGESVQLPVKKGTHWVRDRKEVKEGAYAYKNRRAQMYGELSERMNPDGADYGAGFSLPPDDAELRRQLAVMPKLYDEEGRLWLPPKSRRDDKDTRRTIEDMLGCSPDRADALVLAVYAMTHRESALKVEAL